MSEAKVALMGAVQMVVTAPDGTVRSVYHGTNKVLQAGRALAAAALAGQAGKLSFRIALGSDGTANPSDAMSDMLKPLSEKQYSVENPLSTPEYDEQNAAFRLVNAFTARAAMTVAESGIFISPELLDQAAEAKPAPTRLTRKMTEAVRLSTAVLAPRATNAVLYNRAVIDQPVSLRAGDRLTVTWTVAFVSA